MTILPDMGEKLSLIRLNEFLTSVQTLYHPGANVVIFSDGRVYCDVAGVGDEVVDAYKAALRVIQPSARIHWTDLDMFFPGLSYDERRAGLLALFGVDMDAITDRLENDADFRTSYCGFKRFLAEEWALKDQPLKQVI